MPPSVRLQSPKSSNLARKTKRHDEIAGQRALGRSTTHDSHSASSEVSGRRGRLNEVHGAESTAGISTLSLLSVPMEGLMRTI